MDTVQDGSWNDTATWGGTLPTVNDVVRIYHRVTLEDTVAFKAKVVYIMTTGSLIRTGRGVRRLQCESMRLYRTLDDRRTVDLTGVLLDGIKPSISCAESTGVPEVYELANYVIFGDPGYYGTGAILRDVKPEGCTPAYAEKVSNTVRYLTIPVMINASSPNYIATLYDMAQGPYQVLAVTPTCAIKGFIENITPDPASVGKEYISLKITIAEGPRA
jgi:hypothetical protein